MVSQSPVLFPVVFSVIQWERAGQEPPEVFVLAEQLTYSEAFLKPSPLVPSRRVVSREGTEELEVKCKEVLQAPWRGPLWNCSLFEFLLLLPNNPPPTPFPLPVFIKPFLLGCPHPKPVWLVSVWQLAAHDAFSSDLSLPPGKSCSLIETHKPS